MSFRIEGNRLIIDLDPKSTTKSNSGKTYLLASSNGFKDGEIEINGQNVRIGISYNITRKAE